MKKSGIISIKSSFSVSLTLQEMKDSLQLF